jgi:hypothetical protein
MHIKSLYVQYSAYGVDSVETLLLTAFALAMNSSNLLHKRKSFMGHDNPSLETKYETKFTKPNYHEASIHL